MRYFQNVARKLVLNAKISNKRWVREEWFGIGVFGVQIVEEMKAAVEKDDVVPKSVAEIEAAVAKRREVRHCHLPT